MWHIEVRSFTPLVRCYHTLVQNTAGYLASQSSQQTVNVTS